MSGTSEVRRARLYLLARGCALVGAGLAVLGLSQMAAAQSTAGDASAQHRVEPGRQVRAGWRHWQLGDLSISVPETWTPVSGLPSPLEATSTTWSGAAFAERPSAVETGALLVLAWGIGEGGYALGLDAGDIVGGSAVPVAGRMAGRVDFQVRDRMNDTRGFDVVIGPEDADAASPTLTVTCRAPSRCWRRIEPLCTELIGTLALKPGVKPAIGAGPAAAASSSPSSAKQPDSGSAAHVGVSAMGSTSGGRSRAAAISAPKPVMVPPASGRRTLVPDAGAWRATSWGRGRTDFVSMAEKGARVRYPAGAGGGGAGILSTQTAVRLGDLAAGAETTLTFHFDPAATDGWRISLCPARLDSCWSERGYTLFWQPAAAPGQWQLLRKSNDGKHRPLATAQRVSSELKLRISAAGIEVSGAGIASPQQDQWELLTSFLAFEIGIEAVPVTEAAAQSFALTAVDIDERHPEAVGVPPSASGVEPLPSRRLLAGAPGPHWAAFAKAGGDAAFIGADDVVRVPQGRGLGWTGFALRQPTIDVPSRSELAPRRVRIATDPKLSTGFAVVLSAQPEPGDPWLQSKVWVQWSRRPDGGGKLTLANCASVPRQISMMTPSGWDGQLDIRLQDGLVEIGLDQHWRMAGASTCVANGNRFHLGIFAAPDKENEAAVLSLTRVDIDRVTPAAMTVEQRFELLDDEDFDPIEFLDAMAVEAKGRTP